MQEEGREERRSVARWSPSRRAKNWRRACADALAKRAMSAGESCHRPRLNERVARRHRSVPSRAVVTPRALSDRRAASSASSRRFLFCKIESSESTNGGNCDDGGSMGEEGNTSASLLWKPSSVCVIINMRFMAAPAFSRVCPIIIEREAPSVNKGTRECQRRCWAARLFLVQSVPPHHPTWRGRALPRVRVRGASGSRKWNGPLLSREISDMT